MTTKKEVFAEIYQSHFGNLQNLIMQKLQAMTGLTDTQKLQFISDFADNRTTYGRDGNAFFESL